MKKIICITGLDGTGKSTVVHALHKIHPQAYVVSVWDILNHHPGLLFSSKKDVDTYLCNLTPDARLLFLAHALKYGIDKALESESDLVILNAYYYKYFASELALGASAELVRSLEKTFPEPNTVIKLELDVETAAKRKKTFSRYECGTKTADEINFINFQKQVSQYWSNFKGSAFSTVNASASAEEIIKRVLQLGQLT